MGHNYEANIKCPYCDYEDQDSWELEPDEDVVECGNCSKEFNVQREIEITYSTTKIECEDNAHDYKLDTYYECNRKYIKVGEWKTLLEKDWKWYRIELCTICDDKRFIEITKEEYNTRTNNSPCPVN